METIKRNEEVAVVASQFIKEKEYWLNKLSGESVKCVLPVDFKKSEGKGTKPVFDEVKFNLEDQYFTHLMKLSSNSDSRLHMILVTAVTVLMNKYTGNDDILMGIPVDMQEEEGEFINSALALRHQISEGGSFKELLLQVRKNIVEATDNQNYPIERLVYDLNLTQSETEFPLFDVAVLLENIQEYAYLQHIPNNVVFSFKRTEKSVEGTFRFNPLLYGKPTVQTWVEHMKRVMDQAFSNIDIPLKDIDILSEEDKRQLFETFNDTHVSFPGDLTIHGLFEKQVRETPGEIALMEAGTDPVAPDLCRRLTYKEVDEQSQRLANLLQARGVAPGSFVGIMVERSIEMVLAMLAVLKAGGTYVPVDPEYPLLRRQYMLQDSDAKILLTKKIYLEEKEIQESLKEIEIISVDDKGIYDEIDAGTTEAGKTSTPTDLAYIIYTSGSTGQPKGVMVEHCSIVNTLQWRKNYYSFTQKDNILQLPSFSFDSSVEDIFTPLISGSSLVLIQQEKRLDLEYLSKVIPTYRITHFLIVPGFYNTLLNECGDALTEVKTITVAGESFTEELVINHYKILENVRLFNEYGPTENSVCTTVHEFTADSTRIVIGKPIANVKCYILKDNRSTYPIGCWGELYTSGAGLARGYLKGFRQTEEKFVPHILEEGERMYRTGDLARWLPDGNLEFFGRVDQQVKIRGFRIEPGEIENLLLKYEGVKEAVVTAVEDETRDHAYLCAYVVADNDLSESVLEIKTFLGNDLVEYMVPQEFVFLETLPLTPSGKIDRKALPKPYVSGDTKKYTAPRDKVEKKMATIWAEVLGVKEDTIGIDSNFFALGGHSLKATVLVSRVYKELNVKLPLSNVFQSPTIRQLVGGIRQDESENKYAAIEKAKEKEYYPLTPAQKRLYILNRIDKETISYNTATIVRLKGSIEITQIERIFKQLILRHDSLRTSFHMEKGEPVQKIHGDVPFELEYSEADDDKVDSIIKNFVSPFNLEIAPIFRVGLIKTGPKNHILMVGMHHIISDGISHDVLVQDFLLLYTGEELAPMRIQYKDFSEWVNSEEQQKEAQQQEAYWKNEFSGEIPVLNLPYDFARPLVQSFEGSRFTINLDKEDTAALNALAARENCTLFMVLLSLYTIFLSKVSGQEDIVVGTPIAGRRHADLDRIIGMFVNTMVLRNKAGGD
ncbi:MAG: amino acid adenylation domain-containing protein, partial [bacterium]|nr:amino acid adenylation domain-containing protein [bacterium]